eukprot:TRINITY_DN166_c0_g1_i1.p3 TRINITY_DN166_c0_g1~~TRINITY_DN166_c0_g1_i1.p3  ORF type:complete len:75 (+),score=17.67 TRINITY_DN166_c0_g1_i1:61-285(+)
MVFPGAILAGAAFGAGVKIFMNAAQKEPIMRRPWEHLIGMVIGGVVFNQARHLELQWQKEASEEMEKIRLRLKQ